MEALYDRVLDLLRRLRAAGRAEEADAMLAAMTQACNPRELLSELRLSVSDLVEDGLAPELIAAKGEVLAEVEAQWREIH